MNLTKESLLQEMEIYQKKIWKYHVDPEYVDPNCSEQRAKEILEKLNKEYERNYKIY